MHKRITRAILHFSWYVFVSAIIISVLLVSLIWLTSSSVDDLRPKILEWVNTTTGQPVEVSSLEIEWHGIIPHLKLSDIDILDRSSHQNLTHLDQAKLSVDLYHSLIEQKIKVGHLELSGLNIELVHKKDGTISLLGLTEQASNSDEFTRWLLKQPHLKIHNSHIVWHEKMHKVASIELSDVDLELTNKRSSHQKGSHLISGSTTLPPDKGQLEFSLRVTGDPLSSDWNAILNLTTQELDLASYLPTSISEKLNTALKTDAISLIDSRLNSTTQLNWVNSQISNLEGRFSLKSATPIYSISSDFTVERLSSNHWQLLMPELAIAAQNHPWQPFSVELQIPSSFTQNKTEFDAIINNLRIEDLLTILPESFQSNINNFQPQGRLEKLKLHFDKKNNQSSSSLLLEGIFSDLKSLPHGKIPGFKNLSGNFQSNKNFVTINFDSHDLIVNNLSKTGVQDPPIKLDTLIGKLELGKLEQGWIISTPQITISNPDLEFQLTGSIKKEAVNSPVLDLQGTFFRGNVEPIVKSIPSNLLDYQVKEWLDRSIVSGNLTGGNVVFRGSLNDFPFNKQQGIFEVRLNAENGILDYFEGWPRIEEITTEVVFNSQKMIITSSSAKILDADVTNTTVEIPVLDTDKHHLLIKGKSLGNMKDGLRFIDNSPLKSSVGKKLDHLKISGILDLDLKIDIPLYDASASTVQGEIHLNKNTLLLESLDLELKALNGDFLFDQNRWHGKNLKAQLFESAIGIHLDIIDSKKNPTSDVRLTGLADKNYIINRMIQSGMKREQLKVLESISGTTTWQAQLDLPSDIGNPDKETGLIITSNLKGLNIHAPAPLGKLSNESRPLKISTTLSKKSDRQVDFNYSNTVKGNVVINTGKNNSDLKEIILHFGSGQLPKLKANKYLIRANGNIQNLDLSAWTEFLDKHSNNQKESVNFNNNLLKFDLAIDQLTAAGQSFQKNIIHGRSETGSLEVEIENDSSKGTISIPYLLANQSNRQAVKANFERLKLISTESEKQNTTFNPQDIPELILSSQQFQYNDLQLGMLELHARPETNGTHIEKLTLSSPAIIIDVKGDWTKQNKQQQSKFNITANGSALGAMLYQFGFGTNGIEGGATNISINASWPGSPADFDLPTVKGNLKLDVGTGRFTEIKNRIGKVFGLLSIQSLGRRLSLNFEDLFKKGFTFDTISGDFDIERDNAYTNNLNMAGPSANINVTGRIGLSEQNYDQLITVTPSVSDSLPVASALFGPVGAGVGAAILLVEKVLPILPDTIDKVLEKQYSLKGSWDDPVVKAITPEKRKVSNGFPTPGQN